MGTQLERGSGQEKRARLALRGFANRTLVKRVPKLSELSKPLLSRPTRAVPRRVEGIIHRRTGARLLEHAWVFVGFPVAGEGCQANWRARWETNARRVPKRRSEIEKSKYLTETAGKSIPASPAVLNEDYLRGDASLVSFTRLEKLTAGSRQIL